MAAFLNLVPNDTTMVNGVLFPVNYDELRNLQFREKNYDMMDVTNAIRVNSNAMALTPGTFKVYTFVGKSKLMESIDAKKVVVMKEYTEKVKLGCLNFGDEFLNQFEITTQNHSFPEIEGKYYFLDSEQNNFI